MTDRFRFALVAATALTMLSACDRAAQPPTMNAAALDDTDRGARAGRFKTPADNAPMDNIPMDNAGTANDAVPDNTSNESRK